MESKADKAVECFGSGFNCAQSVLSTYCEELGLDKNTALKLALGLGGGMGKLGEVCGAVSAAFLVIGLKHGSFTAYDLETKEKVYQLVQDFEKQFSERNETILCRELLGLDLRNCDKEKRQAQTKLVCPKVIKDSAEILEGFLA